MKRAAAGAARVVRTTAEVIAVAARRRPNIAAKMVMERVLPVRRGRQRKPVPQTAVIRNVPAQGVRPRKPALTGARLTAVKAAAETSARPVTTTTVITGRRSVFRPTPAAQLITTTAQANVPHGHVTTIIISPETVANILTVWPRRSASRLTVIVPAPTAAASAPLGSVMTGTINQVAYVSLMYAGKIIGIEILLRQKKRLQGVKSEK